MFDNLSEENNRNKQKSTPIRSIDVSKSVLDWAIRRSGKQEEDLRQQFPNLDKWRSGQTQPTLHQLEKFANATYTAFGYLILSAPPEERLTIPHFRTSINQTPYSPSADLLDTVQTMERRQQWMREYLNNQGCDPLAFVKSVQITDNPERITQGMREVLRLDENWVSDQQTWESALRILRTHIEDAGILVVVNGVVGNNTHRKLDPDTFRGFVLVDEYAPLIFVNGADSKAAQMFTLAHELVHIWFGSSAIFDLQELRPASDEIEQICNRVAAEFLVPAAKLRDIWPSVIHSPSRYLDLAKHFKVSELVVARRALDLNYISNDEYREYWNSRYVRTAPRHKGGDFYSTQSLRLGRRFAETVIRAAAAGDILYREAYQLTGLYGKSFDNYAQSFSSRQTE